MINLMIDIVDDKLRATYIMRPNSNPDATFEVEGVQVNVWIKDISADWEEIENLVWVTVVTRTNR